MKTILFYIVGFFIFIIIGNALIEVENMFGPVIAVVILIALAIWMESKSEK